MKCISCGMELNPNFTHAILRNECPACGQSLIDKNDFVKIKGVKRAISSIDPTVSDSSLVAIATFFVSNYDLTPKEGVSPIEEEAFNPAASKRTGGGGGGPQAIKRNGVVVKRALDPALAAMLNEDEVGEEVQENDDDEVISEEERQALMREYFPQESSSVNPLDGGLVAHTQVLASAFQDIGPMDDDFITPPIPHADRLARGRNLRQNLSSQLSSGQAVGSIRRK